jgi:uncharacterized membrane protein (DUF106 family)
MIDEIADTVRESHGSLLNETVLPFIFWTPFNLFMTVFALAVNSENR